MNHHQPTKANSYSYSRKSQEDTSRQVQSISTQLDIVKGLALRDNVHLLESHILTEERSAKEPGRPIFNQLMDIVEKNEHTFVYCWHFNRLTRNPIDFGRIEWFLQKGKLTVITPTNTFNENTNTIVSAVEGAKGNQDIRDLSRMVRDGLAKKISKGIRPGVAPLGYLNDLSKLKGERDNVPDPVRFPIVRKMWDLMLTGSYTPPKILEIVNKEWGFTTVKRRRSGGGELSRTGIYQIFTNPFYAGIAVWGGKEYPGTHQPMVTLEEYDRVQMLLGRKGRPRPKTYEFSFNGFVRCAECGCLYTGHHKEKIIKKTGEIKVYEYYYCTRKKKNVKCSQRKGIPLTQFEAQVEREITKYEILPEFRDWALEILNEKNDQEINDRNAKYEMLLASLADAKKQRGNLTRMRYREQINDEVFDSEDKLLADKIARWEQELKETDVRAEKWLELTEQTFHYALYAHKEFLLGDVQKKKEILMGLGQNPIVKDGQISLEANFWLKPIGEDYPALEKEYLRLELNKKPLESLNKAEQKVLANVRSRWRRRKDSNLRTPLTGSTH